MQLKTGFGYYVAPDGRKLHKFELPIGNHPDPVGFTVVEVANKAALDAITLDQSDAQKAAQAKEILKASAMRKISAVAGLTADEIAAMGF